MPHINHRRGETRRSVAKGNSWYSGCACRRWFKGYLHTKLRARERELLRRLRSGEEIDLFPITRELDDWWYWD